MGARSSCASPAALPILSLIAACNHAAPPNAPSPDGGRSAGGDGKTVTLGVGALEEPRIVVVHVPASVPSPAPLVLNLHGSGGTAVGEEAATGMDRAADTFGFIAAYPQGAIAMGSGFAWNVPHQPLLGGQPVPPDAADDVAFIAQVIATVARAYAVDSKRVYATGMSGGGRMASQLGCDLSTLLAAIAPVAGLRFPSPCGGARPIAVIAFHATTDPVNPYDGGGQAYWTYSVPAAAQEWAAHNGCAAAPDRSTAAVGVERTSYAGCTASADVELYAIDGAGHEWPGGPGQTGAVDANTVMWRFFAGHRL